MRVWVEILEFAGMLFYLFESYKKAGCARFLYYTLLFLIEILALSFEILGISKIRDRLFI